MQLTSTTAADAEGADLRHVNPDTVNLDVLVPVHERLGPPLRSIFGVPIGENSEAGPDSTDVLGAISILHENVQLMTTAVDRVSISLVIRVGDVDGRVDDSNVVLAVSVESIDELLALVVREGVGDILKVAVLEPEVKT